MVLSDILHDRLRMKGILRFHIPLSVTSVLMASSHSIVNSGLARTPRPEIALAAFALGHTIANMFASPLWSTRDMLIAFGADKASMRSAVRTTAGIAGFVMVWMVLLGYTSFGRFVYVDIFGASEVLFIEILSVVRLCLAIPLIYSTRAWAQAVLMLSRKTEYMTVAMIMRLVGGLVMAAFLPRLGLLSGTMVGAVIWVGGMGIESLVCCVLALRGNGDLPPKPAEGEAASVKECLVFLWPLILNALLGSLVMPLINAGLVRTDDPERNLAVFSVVWSLVWALSSFVHMTLRQTVMVFLKNAHWLRVLRRFSRYLQYATSLSLALMIITGLADWLLVSVIGLEPTLLHDARTVLFLLAAYPFLCGLVDLKTGIALACRRTGLIGAARVADVVGLAAAVFLLTFVVPGWGATIGALAMMSGLLFNYLALRFMMKDDELMLVEQGMQGD